MDLAVIDVEQEKAREALTAYRRSVKDRQEAEVAQIMRGYRALARGQRLIALSATMRAGGLVERRAWQRDSRGGLSSWPVSLPALAVARADQREIRCTIQRGRARFYWDDDALYRERSRQRLDVQAFDPDEEHNSWHQRQFRAMVPLVPPPLRPAHALSGYVVLWEAEWAQDPPAPRDPALLKHIGGDVYAVLAVWDLTELERAVLAGRS